MPSVENTRPALEAVDNYGLDDLSDDPFRSPSPQPDNKKRKEPDSGLGIDKEVSIQKRARVPIVKLDEAKLLGPNGIPKLRKRAVGLKIKGKGHEFSDASRLLSFYQLWLDDLFPKARFLDALVMVEKLGHKKQIITARNEWINEGRPGRKAADDEIAEENLESASAERSVEGRPKTPARDDGVPNADDLWDATPNANRSERTRDEPDEDNLEALMAEAESHDARKSNGQPLRAITKSRDGPNDDDLDALMAEAAEEDSRSVSKNTTKTGPRDDFADEEAAMQEMEGLW